MRRCAKPPRWSDINAGVSNARSIGTPGAVLLAAALACALGVAAEHGPTPPPPRAAPPTSPGPRRGALELAGSGSNVPLTRALARAFCAGNGGCEVVVHESVGTGGGLRALRDGVVDLAMTSRPLGPRDLRGGLRAVPYARTAVVLAANPSVTDRSLRAEDHCAALRGARGRWSDGSPLVFVSRERGDSSHRALADALPCFAAAEDDAQRARRFRVAYSDEDLRDALAETRGAVGVTDLGGLRLDGRPLAPLALDGVTASAESVARGVYRVTKDLCLVLAPDARPEARAFAEFVRGAQGRAVVLGAGYGAPGEGP